MSGTPAPAPIRVCPVCHHPKAKARHLVCTSCWSQVPPEDRNAVLDLQRRHRASTCYLNKCRSVLRALFARKRAVAQLRLE